MARDYAPHPSRPALRTLDLFSGIGGFSLGLERTGGFKTVAFCEIEEFPRRVLAKHWPGVPIHRDVRELKGSDVGPVDVICGGFPCQDISDAGLRHGIEGARSALWFEYARLIGELRPRYVIVENVAALLGRGMDVVLGSLATLGYDAQWRCIPASVVGLPQTRDRVWVVAYPCGSGRETDHQRIEGGPDYFGWSDDDRLGEAQSRAQESAARSWRVDDGLPHWAHRIKSLGNAVVPQIPEIIGRAILEAESQADERAGCGGPSYGRAITTTQGNHDH